MTTAVLTPTDFLGWLSLVKEKGFAASDAAAGVLIGKSPDTVVRIKQNGADLTMALACAAVAAGLVPFKATKVGKPAKAATVSKSNGSAVKTTKPVARKVSGKGGKPVPVRKAKKAAAIKRPAAKKVARRK